jgi:hypothetical protein
MQAQDADQHGHSELSPIQRLHPAWLLAAAWLGLVFAVTPNFRWSDDLRPSPFAGDFLQEWVGARVVASRQAHRLYDLPWIQQYQHDPKQVGFEWSQDQYLPMVYPPFYYLLLTPLASISYFKAAWLWAGLMVVGWWCTALALSRAAAAGVGAFRREPAFGGGLQAEWAASLPWLLALSLLFPPLLESLVSGQKGTLCLAILTGTFLLLNSGRPVIAGALFGLMAFKPQLALCIGLAMLISRQWRFVAGALVTLSVLGLIGLSLGVGVWGDYVRWAVQSGSYSETPGYSLAKSHSLHTLLLPHAEGALAWSQRIAGWLLVGLVVHWIRQLLSGGLAFGEGRGAVQFSGLVVATVLLSPHFYTYDLAILLLPVVVLTAPGVKSQLSGGGIFKEVAPLAIFLVGVIGAPLAGLTGVQWTSVVLMLVLWHMTRRTDAWRVCGSLGYQAESSLDRHVAPQPTGAGA